MTNTTLDNYYTEEEVAKILNKSIATLRTEASRRRGAPRTKIGNRILYRKDAFNDWIRRHETDYDKLKKVNL